MSGHSFSQLKSLAKQSVTDLPTTRIALLGDTATQYLAVAIRGAGIAAHISIDVWEADYDQIELQLCDANSAFHQLDCELVVVYQDVSKLQTQFYQTADDERCRFAEQQLAQIERYFQAATDRTARNFVYCNFPLTVDGVFGNFGAKTEHSFTFQLRKLNFLLSELAASHPAWKLCDLAGLSAQVGRDLATDRRLHTNADVGMSLDFIPQVAQQVVDISLAAAGKIKKCLILDLDNTLWGGVIGDDGLENIQLGDLGIGKVFCELQLWIKQLAQRGIILAVCSKNTESIAREPFEQHPQMVLSLEDVSIFVANWENKPDNIRHIQSVLNIGFDSMVFLDDNPFERNIVRENLPEITVPELPEDPAEYLPFLQSLNLFETASYSANDRQRTQQYRNEAERSRAQQHFTNEGDFLQNLEMASVVAPFNKFSIPRVAQLCQRSNQFNLRTIRHSEAAIQQLSTSADHLTLSFTLEDRFGDNGLIGVVILDRRSADEAFIDSWIMSCRVLKRTMEQFMLNCIAELALEQGFTRLRGEYLPTERNVIVANHYAELGFQPENSDWTLPLAGYQPRDTYVMKVNP